MSEDAFGCCKCLLVILFLLENMFDARACDLFVLSVERLI